MGYKVQNIRHVFDDLADDGECWVLIRNPKLLVSDDVDDELDPTDMAAAKAGGLEALGKVVIDWCVWDVNDTSDNPLVLPLPAQDPKVMGRVPLPIMSWLGEQVRAATDPSAPPTPTST